MCTVTIIPIAIDGELGIRIGCNRDEAIGRPIANGPDLQSFGARRAIMPRDPTSQGTWIAVNDAGVAMILLNRNLGRTSSSYRPRRLSRGTIIPILLPCESLREAVALSQEIRREHFAPFRLILLNRDEIVDIDSTQPKNDSTTQSLRSPRIFTSSGLGDAIVQGPRTRLFNTWFQSRRHTECGPQKTEPEALADNGMNAFEFSVVRSASASGSIKNQSFSDHTECAGDFEAQQDQFHKHYWPGAEHLSVKMRRADARTVSYTTIRLFSNFINLTYRDCALERLESSYSFHRDGKIGGGR